MTRVSYTSLRDIMEHPNNASWNEIPIKNPLLKHAALAYLQPMSTPPEVGHKGFFEKLMEECFCGCQTRRQGFGCFNTLFEAFVGLFCKTRTIENNQDNDDDQLQHEDDDDEEGEENVD